MRCPVKGAILHVEPLNGLEYVWELANTPQSYTRSIIEPRVCDADVGAVCFERQTVVAVVDGPIVEFDV